MNDKLSQLLVERRGTFSILSLVLIAVLAAGAQFLYFEGDYKIFFADDNPQMLAHDSIQDTYTKSDNLMLVIGPDSGNVFTLQSLQAIAGATDAAWLTPYAVRVDSITNFQNSYAQGDELIVEDLVGDADSLTQADLQRIRSIALSEKQLVHRLISESGHVSAINISLELPPAVDPQADAETQTMQRVARDTSFAEVVSYGNQIRDQVLQQHPNYQVHLLGVPVINQSFVQSSTNDAKSLVPLMYAIIVVLLGFFLRSLGSVVGVVIIIGVATIGSVGFYGWAGFALNQVNITAPIIILTIAVCDAVHLLVIYLRNLSISGDRLQAMRDSLSINLQPIFLTSITTAIGFLSLNFSDSPPFRELGTICAVGVMLAMLLTLTLMPAITLFLVRQRKPLAENDQRMTAQFAEFVIRKKQAIFWLSLVLVAGIVSQVPNNKLNDDTVGYFKPGVPFRNAADFHVQNLSGNQNIAHSLSCGEPGCINEPAFLQKVAEFGDWYLSQPEVIFVDTYIDVIRRLNKNMNQGAAEHYRIPESKALAAQYQLLYEMSLPYGLDLNNQVNFDKSSLRLLSIVTEAESRELIELEERAVAWLDTHAPEIARHGSHGSSVPLMFAHIGLNNINSMITGSIIALIGVTLTLLIALRSLRFGTISLLPNSFPAAMAFGIWGLTIAEVNLAVAVVFSVTLGIVVDDTVHFISKYLRARRQDGKSPNDAIRYAFSTVGSALLITTVVLAAGFSLLTLSDFNVNAYMGAMTAMTIVIAVVFDFFFLPALLLLVDRKE